MRTTLKSQRFFSAGQLSLALIIALFFLYWAYALASDHPTSNFGLIAMMGAAFGIVLQRSRFCFYCIFTDFFERRDSCGIVGILVALLVGSLGYFAVFGAFLPEPDGRQLPPDAHIGVLSGLLPISAFTFGLGMALAGSCISAQLYRLGEGLVTAPIALLGVMLGFGIGFMTWNPLYLNFMQHGTALWLPNLFGYAGALVLQVSLIVTLIGLCLYVQKQGAEIAASNLSRPSIWQQIFQYRWPTWLGGILLAFIATIAYFRVGALGVTAEIGSLSRTALAPFWQVSRLEGLDRVTGCISIIKDSLWSNNGVFVLSLIVGSLLAALIAGQFKLQWQNAQASFRIFLGGILMGWGAMLSLGCTVGVLLSGIMAGAVSGWVFAYFCFAGAWSGWYLRRRFAR